MYDPERLDSHKKPEKVSTVDEAAECPHIGCDCDMRYPIAWEEFDEKQSKRSWSSNNYGVDWMVTLRCPDCEAIDEVTMDEGLIEKFDILLDRGTDAIVKDLRIYTYSNMNREINRFIGLLAADHILPEDFNFTPNPNGDPLLDRFYDPVGRQIF